MEWRQTMIEFNKAQIDCINSWSNHYNSPAAIQDFLKEFVSIDPKPDKEKYIKPEEEKYQIVVSHIPEHYFRDVYQPGTLDEVSQRLIIVLIYASYKDVKIYRAGEYLELHDGRYWKVKKVSNG